MLDIYLAEPRGFCAGVNRAIKIVERAIEKFGSPIYVRHEIVHNKFVVNQLKAKGAIFVKEIDDIPENSIVIFSAHGVSEQVEIDAKNHNLKSIDATCPLVHKVHLEAQTHEKLERKLIIIGHLGHPEIEGTAGRIKSPVNIVSSVEDVLKLDIDQKEDLAYVTQTTLSIDDTTEIIAALKNRFPKIIGPELKNICYATQNRQTATKKLSDIVDLVLVIGSKNSSNSNRLQDIAVQMGKKSFLINDYTDIDLSWFANVNKLGITAGASAPEILVEQVLNFIQMNFKTQIHHLEEIKENIYFNIPKELR